MTRLTATYRIRCAGAALRDLADALALEQSVEVPRAVVRDRFVEREVMGEVAAIRPGPDGVHEVDLALAVATTGFDPAQTINMLFGNASLLPQVELVDVALPADVRAAFPGPRFGIAGLRARLGVHDRPLTCAALKPQGLPPERLAALCAELARAGIDVIKDDHGLADQAYAPFEARVRACQAAVARVAAETGHRAAYAPSLVGGPTRLAAQARFARDEGAAMVLVAPALVGLPAFAELVAHELDVPVLAHPAYAGATRVEPALLLGKLFRLLGADAVIFPNAGGRFAYTARTCAAIADAARAPWEGIAPALPVPAGGMTLDRVPELVETYGRDAMLLIGGSLLGDAERVGERASSFVASVAAAGEVTP